MTESQARKFIKAKSITFLPVEFTQKKEVKSVKSLYDRRKILAFWRRSPMLDGFFKNTGQGIFIFDDDRASPFHVLNSISQGF
jgi:hypothetical protein